MSSAAPGYFRSLARACRAELGKTRGTLTLWMVLIAPSLVAAVLVLQLLAMTPRGPGDGNAWASITQGILALWAFLMLPLFITLEAALLAAIEHGQQRWRHLLALPLPRDAHYLAKWIVLALIVVAAHAMFLVLVPLGGWVLMTFKPALGVAGPPPWAMIATMAAKCAAASVFLVALHTWIATRWRSFAVACGVGMGATVAGFLIGQSKTYGPWYPWSLPVTTLANGPVDLPLLYAYSACGALVVTLVGLWEFRRSEEV